LNFNYVRLAEISISEPQMTETSGFAVEISPEKLKRQKFSKNEKNKP